MRRYVLTFLALAMPLMAQAQVVSTASEDSSLVGLRTVGLLIRDRSSSINAETMQQLASSASLELRKSGLRVVMLDQEGNATAPFEALVQVMFFKVTECCDLDLRFLVRQPVTVVRNQKPLWTTTWTTEGRDNRRAAPKMVAGAVDTFLGKWLDVNGR